MRKPDTTHLHALELGLSHERDRLAQAKTPHERALRSVWISQREREIAGERTFIGLTEGTECELTDDELLVELTA